MKNIGAAAEYYFAADLLARGITPCWPSVETGAYDLVADCPKGRLRVQVKGTLGRGPTVRFSVACKRSGRNTAYHPKDVDLIVIKIFEYDVIYIIPTSKAVKDIRIKPLDPRCRWNKYREAWHLLGVK